MDKKVEILLNSKKNIESVDVETYEKVSLENKRSNILEYQVRNVMSATETFQVERRENAVYRIYGKIEYMSLLNGIKGDYQYFEDFFNPQYTGYSKTLANSFDFYLVRPADDDYTNILGSETLYVKYFQVMATPNEFELYPAGFSNNVYGEQAHAFSFTVDFDVSNLYDNFGFPLTELFLYAQYIPRTSPPPETMTRTSFSIWGGGASNPAFTPKTSFNIGDFITTDTGSKIGQLIDYVDTQYTQTINTDQTFKIRTPYDGNGSPPLEYLQWEYNPFIPFRLQYLSNEVYQAQLSEVVPYTATTLNMHLISNPAIKIDIYKNLPQSIDEFKREIEDWKGTVYGFGGSLSAGELEIQTTGTYNIRFETQIELAIGTNKYLVETVIREDTGSGWVDIPETSRIHQVSNERTIVDINRHFDGGDELEITVQLIPNDVPEDPANVIPTYATILRNDGFFVWRYISEQGYLDPLTGEGVDYPFINKRRYLFQNIMLGLVPDLTDTPTRTAFQEVWYTDDAESLDITPTNDLDDIGKPCQ